MMAAFGGVRVAVRAAWLRRFAVASIWAAILAPIGIFGGCGGASDPVAVRVGDVSIDAAEVSHWVGAIRLGNTVGASLGRPTGTPRERALNFLISAHWLIGEATEQGLAVSRTAVERNLKQRIAAVPNGRSEFEEELASTGQTSADVKLEIEAELAARALREFVLSQMPIVTAQQGIIDYYHRHIASYRIPEKRIVDLVEDVEGHAVAVALGKRLGPGRRFAKRALRESVDRQTPEESAHAGNGELVKAIFAATPGKVAPPAWFSGRWVLIVVRGTVPGRTKGLKEVELEIQAHFRDVVRRRLFDKFAKGLRGKWLARTDCSPAFVMQKCSQYRGPSTREEDPLAGG